MMATKTKKKQIRSEIIDLSLPAVGEMFLQLALTNVDTIMLGRIGSDALAASGLSRQLIGIIAVVLFAVGAGTTALVARYYGGDNYKSASRVANQSLALGMIFSIVVIIFGNLFAGELLELLGAEPEVVKVGIPYMRILTLSVFTKSLMIAGNSILRSCGDTKSPMIATGVINVVNIILNGLLIFGLWIFPRLELVGAGVATVSASAIGAVIVMIILAKNEFGIDISLKGIFTFDLEPVKEIFRIGFPSAMERIGYQGGHVLIVRVIAMLGTVAVATRQVAMTMESFSVMPSFGLSIAATTIVGQKLGSDKKEDARLGAKLANKIGVIATTIVGIIFFVAAEPLARVYTNDPELIAASVVCLRIIAFAEPAKAINMILGGSFRGAGDTKFPMYLTFVGVWIICLPLTYLLGITLDFGLVGIWLAFVADEWLRAIVCIIRFKSDKWMEVEIEELEEEPAEAVN